MHIRTLTKLLVFLSFSAPPYIFRPAQESLLVISGQTVDIPCDVSGSPIPHIAWTKNGQAVFSSNRRKFTQQASGALRIRNVAPEDSGVYACIARNPAGTDTLHIAVSVQSKGYFSFSLASYYNSYFNYYAYHSFLIAFRVFPSFIASSFQPTTFHSLSKVHLLYLPLPVTLFVCPLI